MAYFTKAQRLVSKRDYSFVFQNASKIVTNDFTVLYKKNNTGIARLGFALSKKKIPLASQRNRVKRILREDFRKQSLPAVDIVFLAKHNLQHTNNALLRAKLGKVWQELTILYLHKN